MTAAHQPLAPYDPSAAWRRHLPPGTTGVDVLAEESLPKAWMRRWQESPTQVVVRSSSGETVTAEQLEERSRALAERLRGLGLETGDRILMSCRASLALVVAYVAAHRLGLTIVPMNAAYGDAEVRHVVTNTTPRAAMIDDDRVARRVSDSDPRVVIVGPEVAVAARSTAVLDAATRDTPALICHTSGTTGKPKGAVLTSGNLLASAQAVRIAWRWEPDDRLALMLPLYHLHGLGVGLHGTLVAGAAVILFEQFSPEQLARAGDEHGATMFFGVPTMYHRLAESGHLPALRSLRLCVSGSAPLPAALHAAVEAQCGQRILERYGMTETVMNVSNPYDGERRPGTVGFPLPGVQVRLAGDAPAGEIQLKGPNVFSGYWNDASATREAFTDDGWLKSGDVGAFDDDGYLRIVGRSKELIITGGYNVYPREVEDALREIPGIEDAAVVGSPSAEWGETVTAYLVADREFAVDEIRLALEGRLARYKHPRVVHRRSELPRNSLGKVLRSELTPS